MKSPNRKSDDWSDVEQYRAEPKGTLVHEESSDDEPEEFGDGEFDFWPEQGKFVPRLLQLRYPEDEDLEPTANPLTPQIRNSSYFYGECCQGCFIVDRPNQAPILEVCWHRCRKRFYHYDCLVEKLLRKPRAFCARCRTPYHDPRIDYYKALPPLPPTPNRLQRLFTFNTYSGCVPWFLVLLLFMVIILPFDISGTQSERTGRVRRVSFTALCGILILGNLLVGANIEARFIRVPHNMMRFRDVSGIPGNTVVVDLDIKQTVQWDTTPLPTIAGGSANLQLENVGQNNELEDVLFDPAEEELDYVPDQ